MLNADLVCMNVEGEDICFVMEGEFVNMTSE
jgi:hypothetical protein